MPKLRCVSTHTKIFLLFGLATLMLSECQFKDFSRLQDNQSNLVQFVNPRIGSQSSPEVSNGNTYPAVAHPWGMNFWTPQTQADTSRWIYDYDAKFINGFRCTHQPSPWICDYGAFSVMPQVGELVTQASTRALSYYHTSGVSLPNYYKVDFSDKKSPPC